MLFSRALTPAFAMLALSFLSTAQASECVSSEASTETSMPGSWWQNGVTVSAPALFAQAARQDVVLLGEHHDQVTHHRWRGLLPIATTW